MVAASMLFGSLALGDNFAECHYGRHGRQSGAYGCLLLLPISRPGLLDMAGATNTNHPYGPLGHGRHSLTSCVSFMQHGLLDLAGVWLTLCSLPLQFMQPGLWYTAGSCLTVLNGQY